MKFLLLLLLLVPSFSHAAAVPKWVLNSGVNYYHNAVYPESATNPWLFFTSYDAALARSYTATDYFANCWDVQANCFFVPSDVVSSGTSDIFPIADSDYFVASAYSYTDPATFTGSTYYNWFATIPSGGGGGSVLAVNQVSASADFCNYISNICAPTVYYALYLKPKATPTDSSTFIPISYWKLTLFSGSFGSNPIYNIAGAYNVYPDYAGRGSPTAVLFDLKKAIHANTVEPDCDFTGIFFSTFWTECVARSIYNFLFIPSDDAIDAFGRIAVSPLSDIASPYNPNSTSWAYVVLSPVFTSVLISACPLNSSIPCNVPVSTLQIPILDVNGDVTEWTLDWVNFVPAYFDAFLAAMLQVIAIVTISYILISKFL